MPLILNAVGFIHVCLLCACVSVLICLQGCSRDPKPGFMDVVAPEGEKEDGFLGIGQCAGMHTTCNNYFYHDLATCKRDSMNQSCNADDCTQAIEERKPYKEPKCEPDPDRSCYSQCKEHCYTDPDRSCGWYAFDEHAGTCFLYHVALDSIRGADSHYESWSCYEKQDCDRLEPGKYILVRQNTENTVMEITNQGCSFQVEIPGEDRKTGYVHEQHLWINGVRGDMTRTHDGEKIPLTVEFSDGTKWVNAEEFGDAWDGN